MKRLYFLLYFFIFFPVGSAAAEPLIVGSGDDSYQMYDASEALLILEQNYSKQGGGYLNLDNVPAEGKKVMDTLRLQHFSVTAISDLKSLDLRNTIQHFLQRSRAPNTRLLLYFAGHGDTYTDPATRETVGYIVPLDAPTQQRDVAGFRQKAISMLDIRKMAGKSTGQHTLLVFDSCFSSSIFEVRSGSAFAPTSFKSMDELHRRAVEVLTASDLPVPDQSAFAPAFVDAINGAAPHRREFVRFGEVGLYVQDRVLDDKNYNGTPAAGFIPPSAGDMVFVPITGHESVDQRSPEIRTKSENVRNMFDGYTVRYFRKMGDDPKIAETLSEARIPFTMPPAQLSQASKPLSVNMVACHPSTDIRLVKKIVETLMDGGVSVRDISQFQKHAAAKAKTIEILTGLRHQGAPLTRAQVDGLNACPVNLENPV